MTASLVIESAPRLGFWDRGSWPAGFPALSFRRLLSIPPLRSAVSVGGGAENANGTVTLENADGALSPLFAIPPLRCRVTIYRDGVEYFAGIVVSVTVSTTVSLSLES